MSKKYSITSMIVNLLTKIHSKNSSLRIALISQRKKYKSNDTAFWGQVFSNIMEIEKYYVTIDYIEHFLIKKNFNSIKSYLDVITYWHFWNKKSNERIIGESKKFFFSSNKEKRLFSSFLDQKNNYNLKIILDSSSDPALRWSLKYSIPILFYSLLKPDFSFKELNLLGKQFNTPNPRYIWINNQEEDYSSFIKSLKEKISLLEIPSVSKSFIVTSTSPVQRLTEFKQGKILIQDLGATIISELIPKVSGTIIDLCAAPGNKTVQIFDKYAAQESCTLMAGDLPGSRFNTLTKRIPDLLQIKPSQIDTSHPELSIITQGSKELHLRSWDGTNLSFDSALADLIFIDAPCTGSGTMGSKPDVRLQLTEPFLSKHVDIQKKMLIEANRILKQNGLIFYSTCSLLKEENENQIIFFLEKFPNYTIIPLKHALNSPRLILDGSIKLFPPLSKTDGFFAILLKKNST